ncbi:MAG: dephospho-CoA kinase [Clostridia bacterium]|nr:MAG: dephospho-CoA kinase [Clostridia bacterium]
MLIGLTGSIAAGKSTVSGRLAHLGAHVLDADVVAREVVEPGTRGLAMLEQAFGSDILTESGMLDRRALAARVFGNAEMLRTLNAITHPLVVECMAERSAQWLSGHPKGIVIWDMALLIECGAWKRMNSIWLVTAEDETRMKRIMARDGCSREHALARMNAQMPQDEKLNYATTVLKNDGDAASLFRQVDDCYAAACKVAEAAV